MSCLYDFVDGVWLEHVGNSMSAQPPLSLPRVILLLILGGHSPRLGVCCVF